nr:hypothetical protein CPGR_03485 [Mycolicibacter nonchromogenicus]
MTYGHVRWLPASSTGVKPARAGEFPAATRPPSSSVCPTRYQGSGAAPCLGPGPNLLPRWAAQTTGRLGRQRLAGLHRLVPLILVDPWGRRRCRTSAGRRTVRMMPGSAGMLRSARGSGRAFGWRRNPVLLHALSERIRGHGRGRLGGGLRGRDRCGGRLGGGAGRLFGGTCHHRTEHGERDEARKCGSRKGLSHAMNRMRPR